MTDLCYNCGACHLPEPCQVELKLCDLCQQWGHTWNFCHHGPLKMQPDYRYYALCHNCDGWHLPEPCTKPDIQCSECQQFGHRPYYCPTKPSPRYSAPTSADDCTPPAKRQRAEESIGQMQHRLNLAYQSISIPTGLPFSPEEMMKSPLMAGELYKVKMQGARDALSMLNYTKDHQEALNYLITTYVTMGVHEPVALNTPITFAPPAQAPSQASQLNMGHHARRPSQSQGGLELPAPAGFRPIQASAVSQPAKNGLFSGYDARSTNGPQYAETVRNASTSMGDMRSLTASSGQTPTLAQTTAYDQQSTLAPLRNMGGIVMASIEDRNKAMNYVHPSTDQNWTAQPAAPNIATQQSEGKQSSEAFTAAVPAPANKRSRKTTNGTGRSRKTAATKAREAKEAKEAQEAHDAYERQESQARLAAQQASTQNHIGVSTDELEALTHETARPSTPQERIMTLATVTTPGGFDDDDGVPLLAGGD